jgi:integrase
VLADEFDSFAASLKAGPAPRGRPRQTPARPAGLTLGQVVEQWQASSRWQAEARKPLRASTMRDYRQKLKVVQDDRPDLWVTPAAALIPADLQVLYDEIEQKRGLATARGCIAVLQSAFRWAISRGVVRLPANPAQGLQVEMPPPRIRFATRAEVAALLAAATALHAALYGVGYAALARWFPR